jgi:broad specificity phosphatase PhoE
VPIYLVRHAHAGSRSRWDGDDTLRPLSGKGRRQTDHVRDLLADRPVGRVLSSPYQRCIETVEPVARVAGVAVEPVALLGEGAAAADVVRFLLELAPQNPVACSHGDVIPGVLRRLHATGMRADAGNIAAKGSVWILDLDDRGAVVGGSYHAPLDAAV